jgi:hypothetical protein
VTFWLRKTAIKHLSLGTANTSIIMNVGVARKRAPAKKLLGRKKIGNPTKYTQLIQFKDDEYNVATATTVEEAKTL